MTGEEAMSTKLSTTQIARDRLTEKLSHAELALPPVKRANVLTRADRMGRDTGVKDFPKPIGLMMT